MAKANYDAIVVGAGFGGSSCAAILARRGLNVLLLEKNSRAGGKAMSLSKSGFTYTAWVVIAAPVIGNLIENLLQELGLQDRVKVVAPPNPDSIYLNSSGNYVSMPQMAPGEMDPNKVFDWLEVEEDERAEALRLFVDLTTMTPQDIDRLHDVSLNEWFSRYTVPKGLYGFLVSLCCDGMFMVPVDALAASEGIRTLQDVLLRSGGLFCQGGWGRVPEVFAQSVEEDGSRVLMRTRVERINASHGRVTGVVTNKGVFEAPIVISNAGIQPTVLKLVGEEHFDPSYVNYVKDLVPSWGMMGMRYFLNGKVTDAPYGVIFSPDTPWSLERYIKARAGLGPKEGVVYFEAPSNYDPSAAPTGKHVLLTGFWCPPDPQLTEKEKKEWSQRGEDIVFKAFPDLPGRIESKEGYSTRDVCVLTRDQVLPGQGGECIGLGQIVGQCARYKPAAKAPLQGLFYVGCDAGGYGVGIHQATDSGINVANMALRYHRLHTGMRVSPLQGVPSAKGAR
ncbi:MAG: NAD(P)/FAD-dependent oxidoreductase [Dehalococcoidia bacterium]|nr:NAD(P)/FAD-dependent oxidoreductase [Dehalococcoidia bacterium]